MGSHRRGGEVSAQGMVVPALSDYCPKPGKDIGLQPKATVPVLVVLNLNLHDTTITTIVFSLFPQIRIHNTRLGQISCLTDGRCQ